jgi:hypothetical protein
VNDYAKYAVRSLFLAGGAIAPIPKVQFNQIGEAHRGLIDLIRLEDIWDIMVMNFAELEKTALNHLVEDILWRDHDRIAWESWRRQADRVICNLLSSGRLVRDSALHAVARSFGRKSSELEALREAMAKQSEKHLGYRTMEALRNFTQHHALPTESLTFNHAWVSHGDEIKARMQNTVSFSLAPNLFLTGRDPDPALAQALVPLADKRGRVAMLPLIRAYMDGLSHVQECLRQMFAGREAQWERVLSEARNIYAAAGGDPAAIALSAVRHGDGGSVEEDFALNIEITERIAHMRRRNRKLVNMAKHQIIS